MVPVRRVIVRDDLGGRTDYRSGCCQRCCQLVDHVDPRPRLPDCRCAWPQLLPHCTPRSSYRTEGDNARRDSSLPRKVKVSGRIHIHLSSVQVRASSAATGCDAAAVIRPIVGAPRATRQRDCPARKAKARGDARSGVPLAAGQVALELAEYACGCCRRHPMPRGRGGANSRVEIRLGSSPESCHQNTRCPVTSSV
jgi:hypothetical protein